MSDHTRPVRLLTSKNRAGLVLAAALGVIDVVSIFTFPGEDSDAAGPPVGVLVAGVVLGAITLIAVVHTWRTASRTSARAIAGTRILSVITALPAFFVDGVPAGVVAVVAVLVVISVVTVALVLSRPAPEAAAP